MVSSKKEYFLFSTLIYFFSFQESTAFVPSAITNEDTFPSQVKLSKARYQSKRTLSEEKLSYFRLCSTSTPDSVAEILNKHKSDDDNNTNIFLGKRKWLGGAITTDKTNIYGIPAHAHSVLRIQLSKGMTGIDQDHHSVKLDSIPLPSRFQKRRFKWLRGILVGDYLFGIPSWSSAGVLRVNLNSNYLHKLQQHFIEKKELSDDGKIRKAQEDDRVSVLPLPVSIIDHDKNSKPSMNRWLWHGAVLVNNNKSEHTQQGDTIRIYCIPANANRVLKVTSHISEESFHESKNFATSYIGPCLSNQCNKWYGGILGHDDAVYGIPYSAGSILRIDTKQDRSNCDNTETKDDIVQLQGDFGIGKYNWHGGVLSPINGAIYAFPSHANTVLKIDTTKNGEWTKLPIGLAFHDDDHIAAELTEEHSNMLNSKYKWLGGAIGEDGAIYGMPSDCSCILRINPHTDECYTFGESILSKLTEEHGYSIRQLKNKWQGGILAPRDGCIYAIPSDAECVLKIDTNPSDKNRGIINDDDRISLLNIENDFMSNKKVTDKWQGGFLAEDGNIYAIPENADRILRVVVGDPKTGDKQSYLELL